MWLMRAVLTADPSASAAAIGATFASMRLIMLALLCVALGRAGASLWMTIGVAVATGGVLRNLRIYQYNYAPFVLMLPLVLIAAYLLLLQWNPRGRAGTAAAFTGMGLLTAFGVNLRTSHTPIYLGMFILFFLAWRLVPGPAPRPSPALQGMALVLFAAGLVCSHLLLVTPVEDVAAEGVSRHLIMHPVVLALAEPPNDLSRREGLAWDDAVGDAVARRIDPAARYLTPGYGPALLQYYTGLWKRYPREMAGVYAAKFQAAGSGVFDEVADLLEHRGLPRRAGAWLASRRVPGTVMLLVAAALGCAGWLLYRRTGTLLGVALALWSVAAVGTLLESALILSRFFMPYHSVLLLYVLLTPLTLAQLAADWTRWRLVDR